MKKIILGIHSIYLSKYNVTDANNSISFGFLDHYFKNKYMVLRHSLLSKGESRVYLNGINGKYNKMPLIGSFPGAVRYIAEIAYNFYFILKEALKLLG